jgi:hypothetical protein
MKNENIVKVCEHLGIEILHDFAELEDGKQTPLFALGQYPELAAGLRGFQVTPYFASLEELESFCERHLDRFLAIGEDEPAPDATEWECGAP